MNNLLFISCKLTIQCSNVYVVDIHISKLIKILPE